MPAAPARKGTSNGAAARREVSGGVPHVTWTAPAGEVLEFDLPAKAPFKLLKFFAKGEDIGPAEMVGIAESLFGDQFDAFWDLDLDMEAGATAFGSLLEATFAEYGLQSGESAASPNS